MPRFSPAALTNCLAPADSAQRWILGFSGGLDSTVLLDALSRLVEPERLLALHINHGLLPHAMQWQAQCAAFCAQRQIPFKAEAVDVVVQGRGLEDAARAARYAVFERYVAPGDCLMTAHHADDQAETLLLRLMRGTGPRGLAAMAASRPLGNGVLLRPLLGFTRAELEAYAIEQGLTWVEDESNGDDRYDRNFLRNQVMPLLASRWPAFQQQWQRTADLCAASESLLDEQAEVDLAAAQWRPERWGTSICLDRWLQLLPARRQQLLRFWLRRQGCMPPQRQQWLQLERQLAQLRPDADTCIRWDQLQMRCFQRRLFCLPLLPTTKAPAVAVTQWSPVAPLVLAPGRLEGELTNVGPRLGTGHYQVRFRQGGERCRPAGRAHSQTLKKLLQEARLEPWLRDVVPLVYAGDELAAVGDLWVCEGFVAPDGAEGYRMRWTL